MENRNIKLYIIPFVAVAVFSLLLFGAGYAYFTSTLTMNTANYALTLPSTTSLICTKTDCNVTITPDMMTNTNTSNTTPKGTSNCSVSCTCSGTPGAVCNYNVSLIQLGAAYTQSSGLGANKEFTVKVTSPTGCTAQNSSSTETQINNQTGKIVSQCSLTVPSSGSVSANVSAEFKWYNLSLDQSIHASKEYNYAFTTGEMMTIYRREVNVITFPGSSVVSTTGWCAHYNIEGETYNSCENYYLVYDTQQECESSYPDYPYITDTYCSQGSTSNLSFTTTPYSNVPYLKHDVINNKIINSYACVGNICLIGGDSSYSYLTYEWANSSYYGTYNGISSTTINNVSSLNPTGNIRLLSNAQQMLLTYSDEYIDVNDDTVCEYNNSSSRCYKYSENHGCSISYYSESSGFSEATSCYDFVSCNVSGDGSANCPLA